MTIYGANHITRPYGLRMVRKPALTETPAAALLVTPTATFAVKPHAYKASTTLTH